VGYKQAGQGRAGKRLAPAAEEAPGYDATPRHPGLYAPLRAASQSLAVLSSPLFQSSSSTTIATRAAANTHNVAQARRVSDYVLFLYEGELVESGPSDQVFSSPRSEFAQAFISGEFG
jgi:hypothetical protein